MLYYGGTPLAYFVAFSMPLAVFTLLRIGMGNEKVGTPRVTTPRVTTPRVTTSPPPRNHRLAGAQPGRLQEPEARA